MPRPSPRASSRCSEHATRELGRPGALPRPLRAQAPLTRPERFELPTFGSVVSPKRAGYVDLQRLRGPATGCLRLESTNWEHVGNTALLSGPLTSATRSDPAP